MKAAYNFLNLQTAQLVCNATNRIVKGSRIGVERAELSESDRKRGMGDWSVACEDDDVGSSFGDAVEQGIQIALAEALAKYAPNHPLLSGIWKLKPDNLPNRGKHHLQSFRDYMRERRRDW